MSIHVAPLPAEALLQEYRANGSYTDCYATDIDSAVSLQEFVVAFYTTPLFKLERLVLKYLLALPSSDAQVRELAAGTASNFAAWRLEQRSEDQLLLCDYRGRTRSWLMVEALEPSQVSKTRLYFGSAVVPRSGGNRKPPPRALLAVHQIYSRALLKAAWTRLGAMSTR